MSAQDDVLAAFGEPVRKQVAEVAVDSDPAPEPLEDNQAEDREADTGAPTIKLGPAEHPTDAGTEASEPTTELGRAMAADDQAETGTETSEHAGRAEADPGEPTTELEPETAAEDQAEAGTETTQPLGQPYLDPAAFFAQLQAEAAPRPQRRWPGLALRYGSALVLAGAIGAGTAYAVTIPRRTDVPFLGTPSDGRYAFPAMVRPAPPSGEPAPSAEGNAPQAHYGDLRQYLVPAPVKAVLKEDGWESVADFESSLSGTDVSGQLADAGIRRVARRGWVMPDGQHTVVELLQFPDHQAAYAVESLVDGAAPAKAGRGESVVPEVTVTALGDTASTVAVHKFDEVDGLPGQVERRVVVGSGDVVAIVTSTAPKAVPDTATEQVVLLEAQMLR